jgi:hypothetical protein
LTPSGAELVANYLEGLRTDCLRGHVRYRAISFNCFHVAYHCLKLGGVDPPPARKEWTLFVPTLGMGSFLESTMQGVARSVMADQIGPYREGRS